MQKSLYLPSLDGLRVLAFLMVLIHHMPTAESSAALAKIHMYGWVGVELFFAISSFLFFHLLSAEKEKSGEINIGKFYIRRMLRIYPLMFLFTTSMLLFFGPSGDLYITRLIGNYLFIDNIISWFNSYNSSIQYTSHLWTISFEFQVYIIIPFLFIIYCKIGKNNFIFFIIFAFIYCLIMRILIMRAGGYTVIWVTPIFRPETILIGMTLSIFRPTWNIAYSFLALALSTSIFFNLSLPWIDLTGATFSYPVAAIMCGSLLDLAIRSSLVSKIFSLRPIRLVGIISFGMYVYHLLALSLSFKLVSQLSSTFDPSSNIQSWLVYFISAVTICVMMAWASYHVIERPFLRLKGRFSIVEAR